MQNLPTIAPTASAHLSLLLRQRIDEKTKPVGALGRLEALALQLGLVQGIGDEGPIVLESPQMLVFAADHGIADENVSAYPQAVTAQMVANMLAGGAAVNVFSRQHGFALTLVDAGVATEMADHPQLLKRKIAYGTRNMCLAPAMRVEQAEAAIQAGMQVVRGLPGNVLALGEMGIANTSSAALLLARITGITLMDAVGRGTGIDDEQLMNKRRALLAASQRHRACTAPLDLLAAVGGFEIAMMVGAMLQAASERRVVLVDGFIAGAAALVAHALAPATLDYMVFCHQSAENGHARLLEYLKARPLLQMDMRLGEGTGALLAWPLVQSAALFFNEMASFESAGILGQIELA